MKKQTIYVLDSAPGATVEDKAYDVIAEGYEISGQSPFGPTEYPRLLAAIRFKFRISCALRITNRNRAGTESPENWPDEWVVTIEGNDQDIEEYQEILKKCE